MHGLNEIKAINDHAALKAQDEARRKNGLKPKSQTGEILRRVIASRSERKAGPKKVRVQDREIFL